MFSKLKEKLKGALSFFSSKAEEEAQEIPLQRTTAENAEKINASAPPSKRSPPSPYSLVSRNQQEKQETKITSRPGDRLHLEKPTLKQPSTKHKEQTVGEEQTAGADVEKTAETAELHEKAIEDKQEAEKTVIDHLADDFKETAEKREAEEKEAEQKADEGSFAKQTTEILSAKVQSEEPAKINVEELIRKTKEKYSPKQEESLKKTSFPEVPGNAVALLNKEKSTEEDWERNLEQRSEEESALTPPKKERAPDVLSTSKKAKKKFLGKVKLFFGLAEESAEKEAVISKRNDKVTDLEEPGEIEPKNLLGQVKESLTTKKINEKKFDELFWDLEVVLLENNVSVEVIERIKKDLKQELVDKPLPRDVLGKITATLQGTLQDILAHPSVNIISQIEQKQGPYVIAFFGVNGAGKTTSIAKLAHYLKTRNKSVVLAACDTFRAAAIDQLEEHGRKLGVRIIKQHYGADAAAVAFDAVKYAEKNRIDVVLIDTAGRLHSNTNLMAELGKIIRVTKPDLKLFVGESITGNDCVEQARKFNELVQMDGAILTKADVDEKGGAPLSISYVIKKPILFLGIGQRYEDFEPFDREKILKQLGF